MLKPIIKQPGVTPGEKHLAKLADSTFLGLWSYPNVYRDEGLSQNGIGQEVADLLVYFENTLVIFSEKEIVFQEKKDLKVAWGRWFRGAIKDSIKQLRGAESFIRKHQSRLFLDKKCEEPFPFNLDSPDLKIHLVAVTRNSFAPCKKYFDTIAAGGSGSLVFLAGLDEETVLEKPFFVTDFDTKRTFVHVLDEYAINLLMTELDTASDFLHYLKTKEHAVRELRLGLIPGEEEFLANYLISRTSTGYGDFAYPKPKNSFGIMGIAEGEWDAFCKSPHYQLLTKIRKKGQLWLSLLNLFSQSILNANVGEGHDLPLLTHERALRCMAAENSFSRAALADALYDKYKEVPTNIRSARVVSSLCAPHRLYVFLFFPHHESHADYKEYRQERYACMELYARVARYKFAGFSEILILATDPKGSEFSSETIIAIDASESMTEEECAEAEHIMKTYSILQNTTSSMKYSV